MADITPAVQRRLDSGEWSTASLPEALAIDFAKLMRAVAPELSKAKLRELDPQLGVTKRMALAGRLLYQEFGDEAWPRFSVHQADTVRGWAAYALACDERLPLAKRLKQSRLLADDVHFGVREWAWIALRPAIANDLRLAIDLFRRWTSEPSVNLRRFAVEITRPRGVWCAHLSDLKRNPEPGLVLLEPLIDDSEKYVQDSVANWLNDAGKSHPEWVREVCAEWLAKSDTKATRRICQRAMRSISES